MSSVGVVDARGEASLVEHHGDEGGVTRELRMKPLDRHGPAEAGRTAHAPEVNGAHASYGELVEEDEPPEGRDGRRGDHAATS